MATNVDNKYPIFYSPVYNISFMGLEKMHAFDSGKWGRILNFLKDYSRDDRERYIIDERIYIVDSEVEKSDLLLGHSQKYLNSLKNSVNVAKIIEVWAIAVIPNFLVESKLLKKMRYQVKGTILATEKAMEYGWAINIGGGFHHANYNSGGGFCVYADISIAIKKLQKKDISRKFLIVDLDAHQGNGHETDFQNDNNVHIMDMYNNRIYPADHLAKAGINTKIELQSYTKDEEFLEKLISGLDECFNQFQPNLLFYNAGTDCLQDDPLGRLDLTPKCIKKRDLIVFQKAKEMKCPIVMVTSGGYQQSNAKIIAESIWDMLQQDVIGNQWNLM